MNTYECAICLNTNHVKRFHCQTCGTIPKQYSGLGVPAVIASADCITPASLIPITVAYGVDRQEHHHTSRSYLRTVPVDYYASA